VCLFFSCFKAFIYVLFVLNISTYAPTWNESFFITVDNESTPVTFEVMDWNRVGKHELVGLGTIAMADLRWLFQAGAGQQRQIAVPVMKAGAAVEGHDRQECHLNFVVNLMSSTVLEPQANIVALAKMLICFWQSMRYVGN
jgi:hypothetical protein